MAKKTYGNIGKEITYIIITIVVMRLIGFGWMPVTAVIAAGVLIFLLTQRKSEEQRRTEIALKGLSDLLKK